MNAATKKQNAPAYLDVQAEVGITKHIGGFEATDELAALCHLGPGCHVLYVGCGIGVGPAYLARHYGCAVTGVDISEKMLAWSRQRAREDGVADRVTFQFGDILDLPFEDNAFDAVVVESVIAFVDDKARAIAECVRVARPGGFVGINETFWNDPPADLVALSRRTMGGDIPPLSVLRTLWEGAGLANTVIKTYAIDGRKEISGRLRWVGRRWALLAIGRLIRLYVTNPAARPAIREQWGSTSEAVRYMGYGLFAGEKQVG